MKGATIDVSNTNTFGNISAINNAGNYEFNYICGVSGNDVVLQYQLLRTYDPTYSVQLISVPVYTDITVSGTVTGNAWNASSGTGGVVVFEATNSVVMNANIDVSGQGFVGAALTNYLMSSPYDCDFLHNITDYWMPLLPPPPSDKYKNAGMKGEGITDYIIGKEYGRGKLANGGGGGNNNNTGGAGGSNYGTGGDGGLRSGESPFQCHGANPGVGGLSLSSYGYTIAQNKIFMGGGGGAGHENNSVGEPGGNGGGIVIITSPLLTASGNSILANGVSPTNPANIANPASAEGDGGGGGGGGGAIILNVTNITGSVIANANGARGSDASNVINNDCTGPGGGGGGGVVWMAGASLPGTLTRSVTGGSNGVIALGKSTCTGSANGATSGTNGVAQTGYVPPVASAPGCSLLPLSALIYFKGQFTSNGSLLIWEMEDVSDVDHYQLERSIDMVTFSRIADIENDGARKLNFTDTKEIEGTVYYRLTLIFKNGSTGYSNIVTLSRKEETPVKLISLQPNPATSHTYLIFFSQRSEPLHITIYNAYGQRIASITQTLNIGYSNIDLPLAQLSSGTYFLQIEGKNIQATKRFIKSP